ncbi:MAG: hypothetical protein LN412_07295 [Candidatus Thermoplasmatota archaeon]|nr:hypothetical protein [Candidatus Thermoplasmatota archaeon]
MRSPDSCREAQREKKNQNPAFVGVGFAFVAVGIVLMATADLTFVGLLAVGVVFLGFGLPKVS